MQGEKALTDVIAKYTRNYKVRSRNMTAQGLDMIVELRMKKGCENLIQEVQKTEGVLSVSLLAHEGESTF